jgi:hypothetical protein
MFKVLLRALIQFIFSSFESHLNARIINHFQKCITKIKIKPVQSFYQICFRFFFIYKRKKKMLLIFYSAFLQWKMVEYGTL